MICVCILAAGPVATPPVKEAGSAPARYHRKSTGSQNVTTPAKVKRPNGYVSELSPII